VSWWGTSFFKGLVADDLNIRHLIGGIFFLLFVFYTTKFQKTVYAITLPILFLSAVYVYWYALTLDLTRAFYYDAELLYGNILFISLVMMIEPKTSPTKTIDQIYFGFVAAIILLIFFLVRAVFDLNVNGLMLDQLSEILAILTMNAVFFFTHRFIMKPVNENKIKIGSID